MNLNPNQRNKPTDLATILTNYLPDYLKSHKVHPHQFKVINSIINCRTAKLGAHIDQCNSCGHTEISYNSCRDRHCPKCCGSKQAEWLGKQLQQLLPIPYFHKVFTLPHTLNDLMLCNKEIVYKFLFKAASETIKTFANDPKYLGGKTGSIGILHTWGQNLGYHVHIHFIVASGGLSQDNTRWLTPKYKDDFLFPVQAMNSVFRGIFMDFFIEAHEKGLFNYPGKLEHLKHPIYFENFKAELYKHDWVVYSKKPFASPEEVIKYLGRYTHRVAISNNRIKQVNQEAIIFTYKDYRDDSKVKEMSLTPCEFIRRFLQHILPFRFVKIRYGGFMAGGYKKKLLANALELLAKMTNTVKKLKNKLTTLAKSILTKQLALCPKCKKGELLYYFNVPPDQLYKFIPRNA